MFSIHFGILQFQSLHASNYWIYLIQMSLKFESDCVPTHYSPAGNGDVLGILVRQNVRLLDVIVSDVTDPGHLPIASHTSEHVRTRSHSNPVKKFTGLEWFQSLASELISPRIRIISWEEADKMTCEFTVVIASAYRQVTSSSLT